MAVMQPNKVRAAGQAKTATTGSTTQLQFDNH
jgi:hypothetical protein